MIWPTVQGFRQGLEAKKTALDATTSVSYHVKHHCMQNGHHSYYHGHHDDDYDAFDGDDHDSDN